MKFTQNYKILTVNSLSKSNKYPSQIDGEDFVFFVAFLENMNFVN